MRRRRANDKQCAWEESNQERERERERLRGRRRGKEALANCSIRKIKRIRPGHGQEVRTSCPLPPPSPLTMGVSLNLFVVLAASFLIFIDLCKTDTAQDMPQPRPGPLFLAMPVIIMCV